MRLIALTVALLVGSWIAVDQAKASPQIIDFSLTPSTTQAGGHPNIETLLYTENADTNQVPSNCGSCEDPKTITFNAPTGVIGIPQALPRCTDADFAQERCPIDSQVGLLKIGINEGNPSEAADVRPTPIYNLAPHPGQAGLIGFQAPIVESPVFIVVNSRTESDYGLTFTTAEITHVFGIGVAWLKIVFWGVPADPANDPSRLGPPGCDTEHIFSPGCVGGFKSNSPVVPFTNNPSTCGVPLTASAEVLYYDRTTSRAETTYPGTTGCDLLSFNPSLFGQPTTTSTDAPSGLEVDLRVPQSVSPDVPAPSEIRGTAVTLPEGFSINSNAADGKQACSDDDANFGSRNLAAECPEFSKVGTLEVTSSSLPSSLPGFVYLGEPKPGDRYRLILVADGFGLHVKIPSSVVADPQTGRLTTVFKDLPQFPFEEFNIHLFGAERGILATPIRCGRYPVDTTFTPWNSALANQTSTQFFELSSGPSGASCPGATRPFQPAFRGGVSDKTAAAHTHFTVEVTRPDGDQNLSGLDVDLPPGLSAVIKGVPSCPESAISQLSDAAYSGQAELSAPACPAASRIGTATAGAGAGSRPLYVSGRVFLAGPYKGSPLSILVVVPAVSGPYDLGNIAVRVAVSVDPVSAQIKAISDPLPQIVGGIPLRTRFIQVILDRPSFALNPTNCDPFSVGATMHGDEGGASRPSSHLQVANCADLPFDPKLQLSLRGSSKRRGHPALRGVLHHEFGEANLRRVVVAMPKSLLLDNDHIGTVCTRVQFAADTCPKASIYGNAVLETPLLDEPLRGPVYLRSSSNPLPDLVIDLSGQIDIELAGEVDTAKGGGLRTTFASAPDAPFSRFELNLQGGRKGLLINSVDLCKTRPSASVDMVGQNGIAKHRRTTLQTSCGDRARRSGHRRGISRARGIG